MQRVTIQAVKGGIQVVTGGQTSTTIVEGSFPSCTVSVFNTGTVVLATIFGDNLNPPTPKSNPFTADANGFGFFYAANGSRVDVQLSGTGITTPFIVAGDILLDDPATLSISAPSIVAFSATPAFDLSIASWFQITLTGNVTVPAFQNATAGMILVMSIIQDGTGGRTFAFPAAFTRPPVIALAANAHTELTFKFDGTNWTPLAASGDNTTVPTQLLAGSGTALLPGVAFSASQTTGFFRQAADVIGVSIAAVLKWLINSVGPLFGSGEAIAWSSNGDPSLAAGDSFLARIAANVLGIGSTNGGTNGELRLSKVNKITITQPANGSTLTLTDGITLTALVTGTVDTGTGTTNKLPKFTTGASGVLGDSSITDNGTAVSSSLPFSLTPTFQTFIVNGTFTIPAGVIAVKVTVVGGGGGGGGSTIVNNGGGGASGGAAIKWLSGLTPGNTIAVVAGAAGAANSGAGGGAGGASSIASGTQVITTVTANGGNGGGTTGIVSGGGNAASISTNGDINTGGTSGGDSTAAASGGPGAPSIFNGGGSKGGTTPGSAATAPGAGGGGAGTNGAGNQAGGAGGSGIVIFEWVK